ncbi:MAG: outer membrane beta-barrel protein [Gemmatimonadaceae bacterium]
MNTRFVSLAVLAYLSLSVSAEAQRRSSPSVARVTPYVGYMSFGSYVDGPLGTSVRNAAAPVYGAQLGVDLTENLAFVGNVGYSASNLEVGVPIIGGFDLADTKVLMYDAGLQLRLPVAASLGMGAVPFVEGGAGAMRTEIGVGSLQTKSTSFAVNYGAGVDLQLGRSLGVRAMAKDYVGKLDLKEATRLDLNTRTTHNWAFTVGLNLGF